MTRFSALVVVCSVAAFAAPSAISRMASRVPDTQGAEVKPCLIKGNISINTGERIYHVPGQTYYVATKIRPEYGERWFCSETEALMAGWRKSGI